VSFPDLRSFIDRLQRDTDIVTVEAPVDRHLEVAEIHRRVIAAGGPALMFTNVIGSRIPDPGSRSPIADCICGRTSAPRMLSSAKNGISLQTAWTPRGDCGRVARAVSCRHAQAGA
jgi:UbiD family decarboxylase